MTAIQFLAEWALRSSILIVSGALLLRALASEGPLHPSGGVDSYAGRLFGDSGAHWGAAKAAFGGDAGGAGED